MSQSQVWKKRSTGLASEFGNQVKSWLDTNGKRRLTAVAASGRRRAGLKRRKF